MRKITLMVLAATLACGHSMNADAQRIVATGDDYTVQKISNPERGEREIDGLVPGGDRENSYTWRLAMRGDEIYIATTRNIASALVNMYAPQFAAAGLTPDALWKMIDAVTNGDILRNDANEGANIICYNRKTGEFKVVYTAEEGVYFRMAVTFGDNVYFGSYSADPAVSQYILKLDTDGNFTKVFETTGSVSLRANCEYDGHLFFAGADAREVVEEGLPAQPTKMAVLRKSNDDDTVWERVADYKDFGLIPFDPIMSNWAGAPFWELANHNGYIYATAPSHCGFVIFRGHPAAEGETANEYGWYWEEVAGLNNGINNPGLSDVAGGEPGTMRSLIGSVYEFNGDLYAYNFDHAFGGEAQAFAGFMQKLGGADVKASDYLAYLYNSLQNPQKIWKLNDATGKFEECKAFTFLNEETTNEYIWRMGQYDGKLYIATMDAGVFYSYLTQLTNGDFLRMSAAEKQTKLQYINDVIKLLLEAKGQEKCDAFRAKFEELKANLEENVDTEGVDEESINAIVACQAVLAQINEAAAEGLENIIQKVMAALQKKAEEGRADFDLATAQNLLGELTQTIQSIYEKIDVEGIKMYLYINRLVMINQPGFDLYRTANGEDFEVITRTGFGDKYNYGCSSFLETEEGLYIGTCNPFYGGQLFLLSNDKGTGIENVAEAEDVRQADQNCFMLDGRRLSGKPAARGIYIVGGKKVLVK